MKEEKNLWDIIIATDEEMGVSYEGSHNKKGRPWVIYKINDNNYKLISLTSKTVKDYTSHKDDKLSIGSYIRSDSKKVEKDHNFVNWSKFHDQCLTENDIEIIEKYI